MMKIEKVQSYIVNGVVFDRERSAELYLARWQLEQALEEDGTLYWKGIYPLDIVNWIEQNRKKVLDYLEVIGE